MLNADSLIELLHLKKDSMAKKRIRSSPEAELFTDAVNYRTANGPEWPD
ncbi:hypothetical protein FHT02_003886 [Sphingomonas xinjiangensis]|uniref:Transposase n=1 Tax=Sphingomonas xinjiangensis TaxID=643568 RepID=A0A840YSG3_9SPHN|nr:hypothetical protein [Sphingomonas xinjiangensis]